MLIPLVVEQCEAVRELNVRSNVLVVDNDPGGSARLAVEEGARWSRLRPDPTPVDYAHEATPGISAARNRALDESSTSDLLAFIDDDERPSRDWLRHLVHTRDRHECAGVLGPVVAEYLSTPDPWIVAGGFFVRPRQSTGTTRMIGFTGNLLLDLRTVRRLGLRFDDEFGLSGGEDTLFTAQLTANGERLIWCDEAEVIDLVPDDRLTRQWVLTRRFRSGTSHSRVLLRLAPSPWRRMGIRLRLTAQGLIRGAGGGVRYAYGRAIRSSVHEARGLRTASRGVGMLTGAWGHLHEEYRRST